jgi:hypothetical protein
MRSARWLILSLLAAALSTGTIWWALARPTSRLDTKAPAPATTTTVAATSQAASTTPAAPTDFLSLVHAEYKDFPATQPLMIPADLPQSARLILAEPIYLDSVGELWITRSDAPPLPTVLKTAGDDQVHLLRERVLFVHRALDDAGNWQPQIVVGNGDGGFSLCIANARLDLGRRYHYHWDRAYDWNSTTNEGFVVPTDGGISIFRPRSLPIESHFEFSSAASAATQPLGIPQSLLDMRGLLAWVPAEGASAGSRGAARFVDGQWQPLGPEQSWPANILHLIPLIGGGVLQLVVNDDATVTERRAQLDAVAVDPGTVQPLIDQLSDPDPQKREAASAELSRYGPGLWPLLEKVRDDQPPEGHMRIDRLLAARESPTLGIMTLLPGPVRVLSRLEDGGVLLLAPTGISIPAADPAQPPNITAPAYICIRPDRPIDLAPPPLVADLPADAQFDVAGEEWIVTDTAHGPRRFLGNHLEPLLHRSERTFSQFIGIDRRGRWLFRQPGQPTPTLLIDPNLPDLTPHLPAWVDPIACETVGWDNDNWPVIAKGTSAWALHDEEWAPLAQGGFKSSALSPAAAPPATTQAQTPILTDADGTQYFDGRNALELRKPNAALVRWPLPDSAVGSGEVHLVRAGDRLFLFNQPGRVLRLSATPGGSTSFKLDATFTRGIPNADHLSRVWIDPAGRIDIEYGGNHLTLLFPDGRVPRAIAEKMPVDQLKDPDD